MLNIRNHLKSIGALLLLIPFLASALNLMPYAYALDSSVTVLPAAPENAAAVNSAPTEITLTWDASPTSASNIASYTVFYKESTAPDYPATPQITRTDSLADYSEIVTVTSGVVYNFIVFANAYDGGISQEDCDSCKASNTVLCGNGSLDSGEDCDGIELDGALCTDYGYISGTLSCKADCSYNFSSCSSGGGGGGGTPVDSTPPIPGTAQSPAYVNSSPIVVTYSGAVDSGGSGLSYVTLLYKKGTTTWMNSGLNSSTPSGSFNFIPDSSTNATYYFDLQAFDNNGNVSNWPTGSGDTTTVYDIERPTIGSITTPSLTKTLPIVINYQNAVDIGIAGLSKVELWYKKSQAGTWMDSGLIKTTKDGSFDFTGVSGSGNYYFDLVAVDKAGNRSNESFEYQAPTAYDIDAPQFQTISLTVDNEQRAILMNYTNAIDIGPAGLSKVELWYKVGETGTWTNSGLTSTKSTDTFTFKPSVTSGTFYFQIVLEDKIGNRSAAASGNGQANTPYSAEPVKAVLSNLPAVTSETGSADITVGGTGVTAYKYKLNGADYGAETLVSSHILLNNLTEGQYLLSVIGKNNYNIWQSTSNPTTHTWTVQFPADEEEVADEGEGDEEEEPPVDEEEEPPVDEEEPPAESLLHCENQIWDADELGVDCGGQDCVACLNILFSVKAKPMGRTPGVYDSSGSLRLYSPLYTEAARTAAISIGAGGNGQVTVTALPANTYYIGLKSDGYLQKNINNVDLPLGTTSRALDYTFGENFLLIGGDVYNDNVVNAFDLALMLKNYMKADVSLDMNRDGLANAADLAMIIRNYQQVGDSL